LTFEGLKPYLVERWQGEAAAATIGNRELEVVTHD
jgi:hypothetical protein